MTPMESETVNIAHRQGQSKLSRLQKLILTDIYEQLEAYLKYIIKYEDWAAEYTLEKVIYAFAVESKGLSWRIAQKYGGKTHISRDEARADFKVRKAKALASMTDDSLPFLGFVTRIWDERQRRGFHQQLLPSFRASISRSLKRLETRGLITREKFDKGYRWSKPKTTGIYLTPQGLEIARQLPPGMLTICSQA